MLKYLLAILAVLMLVGVVYYHVNHEHHVIPAPPVWTEPAEPMPVEPPVVPVEPEPAPVPAPHKPVHKCHKHHKVILHGYYFHGQFCSKPWIVLPGSVTCMPSGEQFLPDELEWSIPMRHLSDDFTG